MLNPANPYKLKLELISMVQAIPENELFAVKNFLESILTHTIDPVSLSLLKAPIDDEPITPEEEQAIQEAMEDISAGRVYSLEEVKKELGL